MANVIEKTTEVIDLPIGKLTKKLVKDEAGKIVRVDLTGSTEDLRKWDEKNFGITEEMRKNETRRAAELDTILSDCATDQALKHKCDVKINLGVGNFSERAYLDYQKDTHYPTEDKDGNRITAYKTQYGVFESTSVRPVDGSVVEHIDKNAKKIEESITAAMKRAAVK